MENKVNDARSIAAFVWKWRKVRTT